MSVTIVALYGVSVFLLMPSVSSNLMAVVNEVNLVKIEYIPYDPTIPIMNSLSSEMRSVKLNFRQGSAPDPARGANYDVPPEPLVGCGGDTPPHNTPPRRHRRLHRLESVPNFYYRPRFMVTLDQN